MRFKGELKCLIINLYFLGIALYYSYLNTFTQRFTKYFYNIQRFQLLICIKHKK